MMAVFDLRRPAEPAYMYGHLSRMLHVQEKYDTTSCPMSLTAAAQSMLQLLSGLICRLQAAPGICDPCPVYVVYEVLLLVLLRVDWT